MSEQDIREYVKAEYKRCASDPIYFFKKYCYIVNLDRGKVKFELYPFQEKVLQEIFKHDYNIILKSRQLGISTLSAAYSLHFMIFNKDKTILVIATKQEIAKNLVTKVRTMYDNLPNWLKEPYVENNKLNLKFANGSSIKATTSASDAGRSEALSLLIIDEAAFIDGMDELWGSIQPALSGAGSKCVCLSTPNGVGNFFFKQWGLSKSGNGKFHPIRLHWSMHPERDQNWRDAQDVILGKRLASQECDGDFLSSGNTLIDPEVIKFYFENKVKPPIEKRGVNSELWIWEMPDYSKSYIISADVARGDGSDFSTCHVIDAINARQVAEYKSQIGTIEFGNFLVSLATEYNDALLVIENANIGWSTVQQVITRGYQNLYYTEQNLKYVDVEKQFTNKLYSKEKKAVAGFTTSSTIRPLMASKLEEYFKSFSIEIYSERLMHEIQTFIWNNGKVEGAPGFNDDLVMALAIGLWVRDTALELYNKEIDLTKSMLKHMGSTSNANPALEPLINSEIFTHENNPFIVKIDDKDNFIDIREWI